MKVLILGGNGMLGHKLVQVLSNGFDVSYTLHRGFAAVERFGLFDRARAIENIDAADIGAVKKVIESVRPEVVINGIGVIKQSAESKNVLSTLKINSIFPQYLGELSAEYNFRLIAISTDCVFSGSRGMYAESDIPDALDLYGQSKHWGEVDGANCLTLRTSIIGRELASQHGLLEWFLTHRGGAVNGYSKAIFSGFPTLIFADILVDIVERHRNLSGLFHVSSDPISKYALLNKINERFGLGIEIKEDAEFDLDRSLDSTRFKTETGFSPQDWDEMIERMASDPTPYGRWNDPTN